MTPLPHVPASVPELSESDFMDKAIQGGRKKPVLVIFHAGDDTENDAGDCMSSLAIAVKPARDKLDLYALDVGRNRALAAKLAQIGLPLRDLPICAGFFQGQILDMLPARADKAAIRRFIEKILTSSGQGLPAKRLLEDADAAYGDKRFDEACGLYSEILEDDEENPEAWAGLIKSLIGMGEAEGAQESLEGAPESVRGSTAGKSALEAVRIALEGAEAARGLDDLRKQYAENPNDPQLTFQLANALVGSGDKDGGCDLLLDIIKNDPEWEDGKAKRELLKFFDAWGFSDEHVKRGRRKLSSLLFV